MRASSCVLVREVGAGAAGYRSYAGGSGGTGGGGAHPSFLPSGLCSDGITLALGAVRVGVEYAYPLQVKNTSPLLRRVRAVSVGWDALPAAPRAALQLRWRALPLPPGLSAPATLLLRASEPGLLTGGVILETDDGEVLQVRLTALALAPPIFDDLRAACTALNSLEPLLHHAAAMARAAAEWDGEYARQGSVNPRALASAAPNSELAEQPSALQRVQVGGSGSRGSSRGSSRGGRRSQIEVMLDSVGTGVGGGWGAAGAMGAGASAGGLDATAFPCAPGHNPQVLSAPPQSLGMGQEASAGLATTMRAASASARAREAEAEGASGSGSGSGVGDAASPESEILSRARSQGTTPHQLLEATLVRQRQRSARGGAEFDARDGDAGGGDGGGGDDGEGAGAQAGQGFLGAAAADATVARAMRPVEAMLLDGRPIIPELHNVERLPYPEAREATARKAQALQAREATPASPAARGAGGEGGGRGDAVPASPGWRSGSGSGAEALLAAALDKPLDKELLIFPLRATHRLLIPL